MCCGKHIATSTSIHVNDGSTPRDAASDWPLIDLTIEAAGLRLVTKLGPKRNAMLDATGRALSGIGASRRIDDA